jgi:hypothetical protein
MYEAPRSVQRALSHHFGRSCVCTAYPNPKQDLPSLLGGGVQHRSGIVTAQAVEPNVAGQGPQQPQVRTSIIWHVVGTMVSLPLDSRLQPICNYLPQRQHPSLGT